MMELVGLLADASRGRIVAPAKDMSETFSLDTELQDLILHTLSAEYTSISCTDGVPTGNHYQSVALGNFRTSGFREDRSRLLDQIEFEGKRVLDLGSNLGEIARAARARGAYLVDGFEVDQYFLEIAELVNVFTGATRVSFYQRDIADPASYDDEYDIVLAFAVFHYIRRCLPRIAKLTDVLLLETHKLDGDFDPHYMRPISEYFPHHRFLGESDWGSSFDSGETRAVVLFGKDEASLAASLKSPEHSASLWKRQRSERASGQHDIRYLDARRTCLQQRFFDNFSFQSTDELLAAVDGMEIDLEAIVKNRDLRRSGYMGWVYWLLYLKGYCQYSHSREIGPGNVYYDYLFSHHGDPGVKDPGIAAELSDLALAEERVRRQFRDMDLFRDRATDEDVSEEIAPLRVYISGETSKTGLMVFEPESEGRIVARAVDGWHRLFAARVFGVDRLRCEYVVEHEAEPMLGAIEDLVIANGRLRARGWCLNARKRADRVALSSDRRGTFGVLPITARPDIRAAFAHVTHAEQSGFEVDMECVLPEDAAVRLDVTALRGWITVGRVSAYHLPGALYQPEDIPEELARRHHGAADPARLALESVTRLHQMLDPVRRYRTLESISSVLDWSAGCGLHEPFLPRFLPKAEVTAIETDGEAVEWCLGAGLPAWFLAVEQKPPTTLDSNSFGLVLGHLALARLDPDGQRAWLEEIHRVTRSGGYAALTLNGELMRPLLTDRNVLEDLDRDGISSRTSSDARALAGAERTTFQTRAYSEQQCARWFDVISYVEGGVNNGQDLIVLRKP